MKGIASVRRKKAQKINIINMNLERKNGKSLLQQFYVSEKIGSPITAEDLKTAVETKRAKKEAAVRKSKKTKPSSY